MPSKDGIMYRAHVDTTIVVLHFLFCVYRGDDPRE